MDKEIIKPAVTIILMVLLGTVGMFFVITVLCELSDYSHFRSAKAKLRTTLILSEIKIEQAKSTAEANKIISNSIKNNNNYLNYLFIESLKNTKNKVIYIPTNSGITVLGSDRLVN